ncbi:hypothetical protein K474DRAFT_621812 [Panus rudis PR-1116 ss-1]|nr:hypothetical protein K474DRAFT_621812 [Panus rudis PR-1116 ss-1]
MPVARLPQEIQDYIVDFLHDDKASLKVCSLLAKSWSRQARAHLFYDLSIPWTVERSEDTPILVSMLAFFQNSPVQARYVHKVRVYRKYIEDTPFDDDCEPPIDVEYNAHGFRTLYTLTALLVNLKMITFTDCTDLISPWSPSFVLPEPPVVPTLNFVSCTDLFISQTLMFFDRSQRVTMDLVCYGDDEQWDELEQRNTSQLESSRGALADHGLLPSSHVAPVAQKRRKLESLCIGYILETGARVPDIMWHLLDTSPTGTLTSLDITERLLEPIELAAFWRKVGTNLRHLRLSDNMLLHNYIRTNLEEHWRTFLPPLRHLLTFSIHATTSRVSREDATPVGTLMALKYLGLDGCGDSAPYAFRDLCGLLPELSSEKKVRLLRLANSEPWNDFHDLNTLLTSC